MAVSAPAQSPAPIALPPEPRSLEETGLPFSFISDLILKVLYFNGLMLGRDLARHVCLPFSLIEPSLRFLADEGYAASQPTRTMIEPQAGESLAATLQYLVSGTGRTRARELLDINQYAGPAPVPVEEYNAMAERQAIVDVKISQTKLEQVFEQLVLSQKVMQQLGPALSAREACFLYGPPGNGKTTIAEASAAMMGPPLFVPRALYVHGEVIRFFDPIHHVPLERELPQHDSRWQLCQRPIVKVGGELTPRMLELSFDSTLGFYEASMQLKANGGLFLVDDFGRQQQLSPRDLLNRLIVPLEKKVDYLNIARAGTTVAVPFTCLLMLSTNLKPQSLMDEAFLRRVRYKVHVPDPTEHEYIEIWERQCAKDGIDYDPVTISHLIERHYKAKHRPFHGSHPRDLLNHVVHIARYLEIDPVLSDELIDFACNTYFVEVEE